MKKDERKSIKPIKKFQTLPIVEVKSKHIIKTVKNPEEMTYVFSFSPVRWQSESMSPADTRDARG